MDGVIGYVAKAATKQLTATLSNKWYQAYSVTCGYVYTRLSVNLVRTFSVLVWLLRRSITQTFR